MGTLTTVVSPAGPTPLPPPPQISPNGVVRPARDDPHEAEIAYELRKRYTEWQAADSEWLRNTEVELDFLSGRHWIDEFSGFDKSDQLRDRGRSAFTFDLLTPSVELVVNQIRINKTTANFVPISEGADDATAEVRQGLYRNIERESKAAIARETGYQFAVSVGRGYWRVLIEDEDGPTFAKKISIRRVDNLQSVAIDPTVLDFNYEDAGWAYVYDDMWREEARAQFETDDLSLDVSGLGIPDDQTRALWFPKEKIRIGEYFRKRWKKREVWRLQDGTECWKEDAPVESFPVAIKEKMDYVIEWRKMTGTQTLEKRIWPGRYIPIVVCIGREVFRGKRPKIHSGVVRPAMHPSIIFDYMESRKVDEVALSPLPHMLAATGHLGVDQKTLVNTINMHPWSVIEFTPKEDARGRQLPSPAWVSPSPNTAAVVQAADGAADRLQRVLNTYAPQLGRTQGDQSGRAIQQVKDSGDVSHAGFPDNFNRALNQEAIIVNDLMGYVYTDAQAITITQPDDKTKKVIINQEYQDEKTGKTKKHLFGSGKYGVAITMGASYPTRMQEAGSKLLDLAKAPVGARLAEALDLILQDIGVPNWRKYADRVRPPGFKDEEDGPSQQQLMQQLQLAEQNHQQLQEIVQKLLERVQQLGDQRSIKILEMASRERIAAASDRTQLLMTEVKAGQEAEHMVLMAKLEALLSSLDREPSEGPAPTPPGPPPEATPPGPPPMPGASPVSALQPPPGPPNPEGP